MRSARVTLEPPPLQRKLLHVRISSLICALVYCAVFAAAGAAQATEPAQLVIENDFVRATRVTIPVKGEFAPLEKYDAVLVRLPDETARFIAKGDRISETNTTDHDVVELLIEMKKHWDAEMRPCAAPKNCTRETKMGGETIAWTTTLFTNGFVTVTTQKVVRGGTLTSSYYTSKGPDKIVLVPFTDLNANFGGIEESLKAGQPYFGTGTDVEVTGKDSEGRWLVLRINAGQKP